MRQNLTLPDIKTVSNDNPEDTRLNRPMFSVAPTIDKGAGGSKSVKVNRMTVWRINVKGEPPPQFSWWKDGKKIETNDDYQVEFQEYQGGSTAILQILKTQVTVVSSQYFQSSCASCLNDVI